MLLPSVHRSFDVGGLNMEGPAPENPPLIAIITTLTKIPIPANIPVATKTALFGLNSNYRYCKKDLKINKNKNERKDYWTTKPNCPDSTKLLGAPDMAVDISTFTVTSPGFWKRTFCTAVPSLASWLSFP